MITKPVIHLLSGGLDSVVLLYDLISQNCSVHCALFRYGQAHALREMKFARWHCGFLGVKYTEIIIPQILGSSLTDGKGSKIVPNRNAIFISQAVSLAVNAKAESVTIACNKDDAADFPDCREEFIKAISVASNLSSGVEVCAPYVNMTKREIVGIGRFHKINFDSTWSCYKGGLKPCGECDACIKRAGAFA